MISRQIVGTVILAGMFWATVADRAAGQKDKRSTWGVPVVMEEATVRGKVVILEDRQQDRRVVEGLRIQLWQEQDDDSENAEPEAKVRRLLNETTTDKLGMFDLPQLAVGDYELTVADLNVRLTVIPKAEVRKDQQEAKVLLILLPREVINRR